LSERYQKTFVSVREFVESWDKEIYQLTNLDFFIYLLINHVGNRLERQYFTPEKQDSPFYLDFDLLGSLCFNIGDNLEIFFKENCFGKCTLNCPLDMDNIVHLDDVPDTPFMQKRLRLLSEYLGPNMVKENCLRMELLNFVLLDTVAHFYNEELGLEVEEDDVAILSLAEFIAQIIIQFMRIEGQGLLSHPHENAQEYFQELLEIEEDSAQTNWAIEENTWTPEGDEHEQWDSHEEKIEMAITRFLDEALSESPEYTDWMIPTVQLLQAFLQEQPDVYDVFDLREDHLLEFLSTWLVQEYTMQDDRQVQYNFRMLARFVTWLNQTYHIDFRRNFIDYYEKIKTDLPRVIRALNYYLNEYDIFNTLLIREAEDIEKISGFYQIRAMGTYQNKILHLEDLHKYQDFPLVKFNSKVFNEVRTGDILQATLFKNPAGVWEILEIHFIYPGIAERFIKAL